MKWILKSNRAFDKLDWWKLLILMLYIIVVNKIDHTYFDGQSYVFAITGILFVAWRIIGMGLAHAEINRKKSGNEI